MVRWRGLVIALVLVGLAVGVFFQQLRIRQLREESTQLRAETAELERLKRSQATLAGAAVQHSNEVARLRAGNAELSKLRGEVLRLKQQLSSATNAPRTAGTVAPRRLPSTPEPAAPEPTPPPPDPAMVSARIPAGNTLVAGGWPTPNGNLSFALLSPEVSVDAAGNRVIQMGTSLVEATPEALNHVGLESLAQSADRGSATTLNLSPEETSALIQLLNGIEGISLVAAPRVTVGDGIQAQVAVMGSDPQNPSRVRGPTVDVLPRVLADGTTVDVTAVITPAGEPAPATPSEP